MGYYLNADGKVNLRLCGCDSSKKIMWGQYDPKTQNWVFRVTELISVEKERKLKLILNK